MFISSNSQGPLTVEPTPHLIENLSFICTTVMVGPWRRWTVRARGISTNLLSLTSRIRRNRFSVLVVVLAVVEWLMVVGQSPTGGMQM